MKKDVVYIDPDDDITGIIDRLSSVKSPIVAAVLPKRAAVLHSSVNMRLLKRAADAKKKRLVLITTEASVLKLAADVRVHVAKSLTSKPELPDAPSHTEVTETISESIAEDNNIDPKKSVGELAGDEPENQEETIELDNAEEAAVDTKAEPKVKKNRKLKVPNFDKFRMRLFLAIFAGVLLLVGGFLAIFVLPKANITIYTETADLDTRFEFTASVSQASADQENRILPAQSKEVKQTITEKFTATGQGDKGNKAKGIVTVYNCNKADETITMPAGSRLIVGDAVFTTDAPSTIPASNFTGGGLCKKDISRDIDVTAALSGDKYNLSERNGFTAPDYADITGTSLGNGGFTGGTSIPIKVTSQDDVDKVKEKILLRNTDTDKQQLQDLLKAANQYPLTETFVATAAEPTVAPAVGQEATEGNVTIVITYTMLGVGQSDIESLILKTQEKNINGATQKIYDNGLSKAKIGQVERKSAGEAKMNLQATAKVGPLLDAGTIAKSVAGKAGGETKQIIQSRPGISKVDVVYSPFWVLKTPNRVNRITINFQTAGD